MSGRKVAERRDTDGDDERRREGVHERVSVWMRESGSGVSE